MSLCYFSGHTSHGYRSGNSLVVVPLCARAPPLRSLWGDGFPPVMLLRAAWRYAHRHAPSFLWTFSADFRLWKSVVPLRLLCTYAQSIRFVVCRKCGERSGHPCSLGVETWMWAALKGWLHPDLGVLAFAFFPSNIDPSRSTLSCEFVRCFLAGNDRMCTEWACCTIPGWVSEGCVDDSVEGLREFSFTMVCGRVAGCEIWWRWMRCFVNYVFAVNGINSIVWGGEVRGWLSLMGYNPQVRGWMLVSYRRSVKWIWLKWVESR